MQIESSDMVTDATQKASKPVGDTEGDRRSDRRRRE